MEKLVKITQVMQREEGNRASSACPTAPFPTFSCGGNGAFRALASATAFLDLAVKFSCVGGEKRRNYREVLPGVGAALCVSVCGRRADTRRPEVLVACSRIRVQ